MDWVGIDGYYYRAAETFGIVFGHTLREVRALTRKPVLISETAVAPAAGKALHIPGLFAGARRMRKRLRLVELPQAGHHGLIVGPKLIMDPPR